MNTLTSSGSWNVFFSWISNMSSSSPSDTAPSSPRGSSLIPDSAKALACTAGRFEKCLGYSQMGNVDDGHQGHESFLVGNDT